MKSFLIKILVFACVFLVIVSIYILFINYSLNHHNYFKINSSTENVILGNSHPECALNDSLIPSFQNFAQGGEAYFYTLIKLKKISENNPQVKTVFVEFGNNDIKKEMDQWVWGTKYINARYPMYSAFMNMSEQSFLALKNPTAIATILPVMIKSNFLFLSGSKKDYLKQFNWGGYFFLNRFINDSSIHKYRLDSTNEIVISYLSIFYLRKKSIKCNRMF